VLGSSVGRTIVRVDVDATKLPAGGAWSPAPAFNLPPWALAEGAGFRGWDCGPIRGGAAVAPFALVNPHQAVMGVRTTPYRDDPEYSGWRDKLPPNDFY
jgi:hypothetical protein